MDESEGDLQTFIYLLVMSLWREINTNNPL